jgi:hypothetical protein
MFLIEGIIIPNSLSHEAKGPEYSKPPTKIKAYM